MWWVITDSVATFHIAHDSHTKVWLNSEATQ